jgi:predicted GNAT family acetyltransferase
MHPLDNPVWQALTTSQQNLAVTSPLARKFPADVSVLAAVAQPTAEAHAELAQLAEGSTVGLFLEATERAPEGWAVDRQVELMQMLHSGPIPSVPPSGHEFVELTHTDVPEMMALTSLTNPGPFGTRTRELGTYLGIRRRGVLAAMAGERMRIPGYTEISAVCTHPGHLGHGYATALMVELMRRIQRRGEKIFLHVRNDNARAIELYLRLGFVQRYQFQYAVMRWQDQPITAENC